MCSSQTCSQPRATLGPRPTQCLTLGPASHLTNSSSNTTLPPNTGKNSPLTPSATEPHHYADAPASDLEMARPSLALRSVPPCRSHHQSPVLEFHSSLLKSLLPLITCSKSFKVSHYPPISQLPPVSLALTPTFHSTRAGCLPPAPTS